MIWNHFGEMPKSRILKVAIKYNSKIKGKYTDE